jgi:hypothetical protein
MTAQNGARDSFHPLPLFLTRPSCSERIARPHVDAPTATDRVHAKARPLSASIGNVWALGHIDGNG